MTHAESITPATPASPPPAPHAVLDVYPDAADPHACWLVTDGSQAPTWELRRVPSRPRTILRISLILIAGLGVILFLLAPAMGASGRSNHREVLLAIIAFVIIASCAFVFFPIAVALRTRGPMFILRSLTDPAAPSIAIVPTHRLPIHHDRLDLREHDAQGRSVGTLHYAPRGDAWRIHWTIIAPSGRRATLREPSLGPALSARLREFMRSRLHHDRVPPRVRATLQPEGVLSPGRTTLHASLAEGDHDRLEIHADEDATRDLDTRLLIALIAVRRALHDGQLG